MSLRFSLPVLLSALLFSVPAFAGDATAGQEKASTCVACHGLDGNSTDPANPKIAGQNARYIERHVKLIKSGTREAATMLEFAQPLSDQDIADIAAYYATQKVRAGNAEDEALALKGQALYRGGNSQGLPSCMGCHGPSGKGNPGSAYPAIGGQHSSYTKTQLERFRAGQIWGEADAPGTAIMSQVAKKLTDEEIAALSAYLQGLHAAE
jgi:cytochrome c553